MTTLKLNTLSARIQAHKMALVHIVKPLGLYRARPSLYGDVSAASR